jgi:hypothetical protein
VRCKFNSILMLQKNTAALLSLPNGAIAQDPQPLSDNSVLNLGPAMHAMARRA